MADAAAAGARHARDDEPSGPAPASSSSSSSPRAARASRRASVATAQAPPRARHRTAAERARLADLFLDVIGVVVAHNRGLFAHECWQCQYLCRETRYIAGVTQPGSTADMVFHGCRLGGVTKLLQEARACKRERHGGYTGTTQLIIAVIDNDLQRMRALLGLGCPNFDSQCALGRTALQWASRGGHEAAVRELLAHGADASIASNAGMTPLMAASAWGHLAVARLLSGAPRADLSAQDSYEQRSAPQGCSLPANARRTRVSACRPHL